MQNAIHIRTAYPSIDANLKKNSSMKVAQETHTYILNAEDGQAIESQLS
jgi:hypothetical protein